MNKKILPTIISFILFQFSALSQTIKDSNGNNYYKQGTSNRTVAEWEPAKGTMVVWPLSVPYKLVVELAKDNHLYTLVANDSTKIEAQKWYDKWGIEKAKVTFVQAPQGIDAWWTRDWGPSAIFTPDGTLKLGDGKYIFSTPYTKMSCDDSLNFIYIDQDNKIIKTETDDNATVPLAKGLGIGVLDLPFINTGGNVLTDGLGTAFSSCILLNENKFYGVSKETFFRLNKELAGFDTYYILPNFEKRGIQHIDCLMKLLDEERILVAEPPTDHELYSVYENIVENELKKLKSVYGRPYQIIRIKTGRYDKELLAAYTNSIIINKTIYVPLFQIKEDSEALQTWQQAMPGYKVKGFTFALKDEPFVSKDMREHYKSGYGWDDGDALHCRTKAVWDSEMLFITTKRIDKIVDSKNRNIAYTTIIDYSKLGLLKNKSQLFWRPMGETNWRIGNFKSTESPNHFFYEIPYHKRGSTIEYYISAVSKSGRKETQPRTAPMGTYKFSIE